MGQVRSYRDPAVGRRSKDLCKAQRTTECTRRREMFGSTGQLRRAAASIPSNVPQGCNRKTRPGYLRGLPIAGGSRAELSIQRGIAMEPGMAKPKPAVKGALVEVNRMLLALIARLADKEKVSRYQGVKV